MPTSHPTHSDDRTLRRAFLPWVAGLLTLAAVAGCQGEKPAPETTAASTAPYDFAHPSATFTLPDTLLEISGLTLLDSAHLGAIQDENGTLFVLDTGSGRIVREIPFGEDGDYEGVEVGDSAVFVLRSDGGLFAVHGWQVGHPRAESFATSLPTGCDAEGLGSDPAHRRLLIACKGGTEANGEHTRALYAFDLTGRRLFPDPVLVLDAQAIAQTPGYDRNVDRVLRDLTSGVADLSGFTPSALATDPQTGHLVVLSSGQKALIVIDSTHKRLLHLWRLPEQLFPQPEGLALAPDGTLYISNEGNPPSPATLLRFEAHPLSPNAP